ncbi:MAG: hypothetical protein K1X38_07805 [Microthrixaceae bacterium]|nr:hypothetical protein [Microthrixaceae bacterium]
MLSFASLLAAEAAEGAHVWHFWLAALLAPATILAIVGTVAMYFFKVTRARYPRK